MSFAIAAITYLMTIEPTASFWDCGEFIASAYKLEVGHPPGAPFFMLTGKFFTLFASDVMQVAAMVNAMSALLSALTILFLFWTITHLTRKLIHKDNNQEMTLGEMIIILGSGLVGALAYTYTDTFWFSAVEGEVYAYSSMFTALVFWLILKWENRADEPGSDKWLVVIAYTMGLSIGVHLLNLLCIPAIVLVYYFKKKEKADAKGTLLALAGSFALIVFLMYGIIPGFTKVGGWFELFFINSLGFSYNTGVLLYLALLLGTIVWGLYETLSPKGVMKRAKIALVVCLSLSGVVFIGDSPFLWLLLIAGIIAGVVLYKDITARVINTTILCLMVILVGYSSFALIPIRSIANTPMDQNSPEHVFTLAKYLNREQYGDRPLVYGKTYASEVKRDATGRAVQSGNKKDWDKVIKKSENEPDRYVVVSEIPSFEFTNTTLLPRMHSDEDRHIQGYKQWAGITDTEVTPSLIDNMKFFFSYQLNFMYFRYFMWNFSGRQNDIQGNGEISNGNWITGFKWFDEHVLGRGPQDNLPPSIAENKGHNKFYALPFILGILGIVFQLRRKEKGEQQFLVTFMLFFMTGIAIILYLNQQPQEPRERDYAYAGSFYAYCIWIGLGVACIWDLLRKKFGDTPSAAIATVLCLIVPIQMGTQTWDDHDRSDRYTMRDFGQNYLVGLPQNSILFTMGDNDTFPLWYAQEVEGFRTDVRVTNLSYLQTDWYVDQMRRDAYDSPALPITWEADRYSGLKGYMAYMFSNKDMRNYTNNKLEMEGHKNWMGSINYSNYFDTNIFKDEMSLDEAMEILKTKDNFVPRSQLPISNGLVLPSTKFITTIDTTKVDWKALGTKPSTQFAIDLSSANKESVYRQEIMIMEMLNNISKDDWKRPIYYAVTIGSAPLNLQGQSMLEGINQRIVPGQVDPTRVNTEVMFDNMVNKYKWGGIENPKVYLDENNQRMAKSFRAMFRLLIDALIIKEENEKALQALNRCIEAIPGNTVPRGMESISFVENYFELGERQKGEELAKEILYQTEGSLQWFARFNQADMFSVTYDIREALTAQYMILDILQRHDSKLYTETFNKTNNFLEVFMHNQIQFPARNHPLVMNFTMAENAITKRIEADSTTSIATGDSDLIMLERAYRIALQYEPKIGEMLKYKDHIRVQ